MNVGFFSITSTKLLQSVAMKEEMGDIGFVAGLS